jgi:hypothetical protein
VPDYHRMSNIFRQYIIRLRDISQKVSSDILALKLPKVYTNKTSVLVLSVLQVDAYVSLTGLLRQGLHDRSLLSESSHAFNILTDAIEARLDYMGSPTLMGRISHIILRLKDDRHGPPVLSPGSDLTPPSTLVFLNLEWSQLHLMITRSTTPDIIKMAMKLTEFFNAQLLNSKNILASIQYDFHDGIKRNNIEKKVTNGQSKYDTNVIKRYIGMHGGELMLQGHNKFSFFSFFSKSKIIL